MVNRKHSSIWYKKMFIYMSCSFVGKILSDFILPFPVVHDAAAGIRPQIVFTGEDVVVYYMAGS